ncbi:MAG: hypothetical protein R6V06_07460 [Kiritimatiellia bacterium]
MNKFFYISLTAAVLLAGCLTNRQLIAERIQEKQSFFSSLPPAKQERLRKGEIQTGDSRDAVWIVYGDPDRKFTRVSGSSTNEIWSYSACEFDRFDRLRPLYHPVRASSGRTIWRSDYIWTSEIGYQVYEYMRIEFENNRIKGYEEEKRK